MELIEGLEDEVRLHLIEGIASIWCATDYTVPAMDVNIEEARFTFETNFFSVIRMCQTFLPLLMKSKGTIVQIGSVAGVSDLWKCAIVLQYWRIQIIPYVFGSVYNASKAALHSWSDTLRVELAPFGYVELTSWM